MLMIHLRVFQTHNNYNKMKITIKELRQLIREKIQEEESKDKTYKQELEDDPSYKEKSVLVPDDIKKKIKKWSRDMKLSH